MSELPVPGNVFFSDFAGEVVNYHLERAGTVISVVRGIPNRENRKSVIHFEFKSGIQLDDVLISPTERLLVKSIEIETYNSVPELITVFV